MGGGNIYEQHFTQFRWSDYENKEGSEFQLLA